MVWRRPARRRPQRRRLRLGPQGDAEGLREFSLRVSGAAWVPLAPLGVACRLACHRDGWEVLLGRQLHRPGGGWVCPPVPASVPDGGPAPVHEEFLPGWELPASEVQVGVAVDCRAGAQPGGIRGLAFPFHLSTAALGLAVGSAGDGPPTEACLGCGGVRIARVRREQHRLGAAVWAYWPSVGWGLADWGLSVRE